MQHLPVLHDLSHLIYLRPQTDLLQSHLLQIICLLNFPNRWLSIVNQVHERLLVLDLLCVNQIIYLPKYFLFFPLILLTLWKPC